MATEKTPSQGGLPAKENTEKQKAQAKPGTGAVAINVPVQDPPPQDRRMSVKSADEHEREAVPDKGVPPDFLWCVGFLLILAIIFVILAVVMHSVAKNKGILDLTRDTYEL